MARWNLTLYCMSIIFVIGMFKLCGANDEERKLYIIYMGSLPKEEYSATSHHANMLQQVMGDKFSTRSVVRNYNRSFNGFAAKLTDLEKQNVARMEGVVSVFESKTLYLQTTRSWDFIGFPKSTRQSSHAESDIIIGVLDSGIWPESDSFSDEGFGPAPKKWKGTCAGGENFTCNNKIIGARYYGADEDRTARDHVGHGSHTASTAAGNKVKDVSFYGLAKGTARGGVPSARIAVYKVCRGNGCSDADILAGFDEAIADGVDIITISIGGSIPVDFKSDSIAIGSFHATKNGILTVHSAGNSGPRRGSIVSVAPWLFSVAAGSIDRQFVDKISLGNGLTLVGKSINAFKSNGTKVPLVLGKHASFQNCESDPEVYCTGGCLDPKLVKGKIVLCSSADGVEAAFNSGAVGSIVKDSDSTSFVVPNPSSSINSKAYALVLSYINSTRSPQVEILKSEAIRQTNAPRVTDFSSRGPNSIVPEILKPDITAPGLEILAAFSPIASPSDYDEDKRSVKYNIISGTSMSCPHVAGAAAYVKSIHPDWSPAAIKSSIMTTAKQMNGSEDKEFAYGAGHVNPVHAIKPGLVYELSEDDYVKLLCNIGYDTPEVRQVSGDRSTCPSSAPRRSVVNDVNYPSLSIQVQPGKPFKVNISRTVTNVGSSNSTYKANILPISNTRISVVPEVLSFKSLKEKQSFVVTVTGGKFRDNTVLSSSLVWTDGTHSVRSPIVVYVS